MATTTPTTELALRKRLDDVGVSTDNPRIAQAIESVAEIYGDDQHWTGVSMIEHVTGVLGVLSPFQPDEDAVIACLLHHALETKRISLLEIEDRFGAQVRKLVGGIHLLAHVTAEGRRAPIDDLRLMLLSVSDDVRTILIVLCDREHVLTFLPAMAPRQRKLLCTDVLQLFAPVAARLGIYTLKHSLENHAFPILYPHDAERIEEQLDAVHAEKGEFLERAAVHLRDALRAQGIEADVEAREKQRYSIFAKMRRKSCSHVEQVYDLFALRVIVRSVDECYQVLGLLHRMGRPLSDRFKDFIAFPKPNGYQSVHTTLAQLPLVPSDTTVEVQIRTRSMNREAKYGVAAHWQYKEYGSVDRATQHAHLQRVIAGQHEIVDQKDRAFADHIYVLTPKGDVMEFPEGATPLDFAFHVHTDIGLSFKAAIVNGSIVPLDYELENGDVVEIQRHGAPRPSPQWMQMLKMASSRTKLRTYLALQQRPEHVVKGRALVNAELRRHALPPLDSDLSILKICDGHEMNEKQREDLLFKVAQGSENAASLLWRLGTISIPRSAKRAVAPPRGNRPLVLAVEGSVPMPLRPAKCCTPEDAPGAPVVGLISRTGQVVAHKRGCRMLKKANPGRRIEVRWK